MARLQDFCQKWRPIQYVDGNTGEIFDIDSDGSFIEFLGWNHSIKDVDNFNQASDVAGGSWGFQKIKPK